MLLLERLEARSDGNHEPFLIAGGRELRFSDVAAEDRLDLSSIRTGDVVALIGDFDTRSVQTLLRLIDLGVIVVPLTLDTASDHQYFYESALVDVTIRSGEIQRREHGRRHPLIDDLRERGHGGLVLFTTGTTAKPKAILHDMPTFLEKFETPRPALRTINFLLFDHIGGINTLLHTLFNGGVLIAPESRTAASILRTCREQRVELLPTTPSFMRMMLMSGLVPEEFPDCVKIITYGTELMDQPTLDQYCGLLPNVDFRQTYGMSELGIVRTRSKTRQSLFVKIGGEGVQTRVVDNVLQIRSDSRMLGYLNAPSPFDEDGWYDTKDVVEVDGPFYRIVGRVDDVINVGGLKFMASDVEGVALAHHKVELVKAEGKANPITGQHVEMTVQPVAGSDFDKAEFRTFLIARLPEHMVPRRIAVGPIAVGHRFKRV